MTHSAAPILAPGPFVAMGFAAAFRSALRRITWKVVAATLAITAALEVWSVFENALDSDASGSTAAEADLSFVVINLAMTFAIMFTTLLADEMVKRGARRWPTYAQAIVAGCAVGALVQWQLHQWLGLRTHGEVFGASHDVIVMQPLVAFFEYLIWGSIIVFIYVSRRSELLAAARMSAAQLERAQMQRRTVESRLQALQARIEPQFLFNALAQMRDLYEERPALGSRMLEDLSVYLRAALPQLRDSTSTLEKELKLLAAYMSILRVSSTAGVDFDIDAAPAALAARVPAMILLPLVDQVLAGEGPAATPTKALAISARVAGGVLRVELSGAGPGLIARSAIVLRDIRERLAVLYGDRATLAVEPAGGAAVRLVAEIPHEPADGDHR
jgi:Histidine kinase